MYHAATIRVLQCQMPQKKYINYVVLYSAVAICWELYVACFEVTISTVNSFVMYLPWWTKRLSGNADNILSAFIAHKCTALHKQKHNCQPSGTVPWVCFAARNAATASLCGTVPRLSCKHELSSCKPFGTVRWLFCSDYILSAFTTHKWTGLHKQKKTANELVLYHACIAVPGGRTVKHMVRGWNCFAIMNSTAANCLTLYLACFAIRNSTANCSVMCLPWPYSNCTHCV